MSRDWRRLAGQQDGHGATLTREAVRLYRDGYQLAEAQRRRDGRVPHRVLCAARRHAAGADARARIFYRGYLDGAARNLA